jgi:hypothetical protein
MTTSRTGRQRFSLRWRSGTGLQTPLHQFLPHLSDPDHLQDTSTGQQSEEKKDKDTGKRKHAAQKGKEKRRTVQAAQPQLPWLAADAFAAALGVIPQMTASGGLGRQTGRSG